MIFLGKQIGMRTWLNDLKNEIALIEWPSWPSVWVNVLSVLGVSVGIGVLVWVFDLLVTAIVVMVGNVAR